MRLLQIKGSCELAASVCLRLHVCPGLRTGGTVCNLPASSLAGRSRAALLSRCAASFVSLVAVAQLIAGTAAGDWMHTSQIVEARVSSEATWGQWSAAASESAFEVARRVLWGEGDAGVALQAVGDLQETDDLTDDDAGVIPPGGSRVSTEYGLWNACVWTKTVSMDNSSVREALRCKPYDELAQSGAIADDDAGAEAPIPSSVDFAAAQVLSVTGSLAGSISAALIVAAAVITGVTYKAEDAAASGTPQALSAAVFEDLGQSACFPSRGPPFPTTGWTGRFVVGAAASMCVAVVFSLAALGAWADSLAASELQSLANASDNVLSFGFGSAFVVVGLGSGCGLVAVVALGLGYLWFRDPEAAAAAADADTTDYALLGAEQAEPVALAPSEEAAVAALAPTMPLGEGLTEADEDAQL